MGRISKISIAAFLALAIASCSSEGERQSSSPTPTDDTSAVNTPAANQRFSNPKATSQPFNNPVVPARQIPPVASVTTPNLIQSTNATERLGIVSKGRTDPFAQIVDSYPMGVTNTTAVAKPVPKLPSLPVARGTQSSVAAKTRNLSNQQKLRINQTAIASAKANPKRTFTRVLPQVLPNPGLASVLLPPPPQPELARAVIVSGVVLLTQEPQAIIKVPTEPTSRYVQAGQRLANGVLIKRIEINKGSEPVVILEQYGIEVARMVGEGIASQIPSTAASGGNPVSLTVPPQNPVPGGAT
ncbi:hypothetical protein BZZ01_29430 [Nostocales cyanobacterium HT-58-2]|nr:hypothetical protein BZZ01_29430 [Nostocales cyanobacterium HT-58-2]